VGLEATGPGVLQGSSRWLAIDSLVFVNERTGARMEFLPEPGAAPRFLVIGTDCYVRIDDRLFTEVLGPGWASQPATLPRAVLYQNAEQWKEAADTYEELLAQVPSQGRYAFYTGFYGLKARDVGQALRGFHESIRLGRWPEWSHYYIGAALASRGDTDRALDALEQAVSLGFADGRALAADPWWKELRAHARFVALLKRIRKD
jgi:tetratricopeptide (TPR) repeat protein